MSILSDIASGLAKGAANISGAAVTGALGSTLGGIVNTSAGVVATGAKESGKQTAPTGDPTKDTVNAVRDLQSDFNSQSGIQQQTLGTLQNHSALFGYMLKQSALTNKYLEKLLAKNFTNVNVNAPFGLGGLGGIGSLVRPLLGAGAGALVGGAGGELFGRGVNDLLKPLKRMFGYTADRFPNMARWGEQHSIHGYKSGLPEGVGKSPDIMSMLGLSAKADDLSPAMSDLQRRQEQQKRDAQIQSISELTYEAREIKFKADKITFEMTGAYSGANYGVGSTGMGSSGSTTPGGGAGGGGTPGDSGGGGGTGGGEGGTGRGAGGSTGRVTFSKGLKENQREAYNAFKQEGMSDSAARIAVANLSGENLASPHNVYADPSSSNPNQHAHGIAAWDDFRSNRIKKQFGKFPQEMSVSEQAKAHIWEMKTYYKQAWSDLNNENLPDEQRMGSVVRNYERPRYPGQDTVKRLNLLKNLSNLGKEGTTPESEGDVVADTTENRKRIGKKQPDTKQKDIKPQSATPKTKTPDKHSGLTEDERFHQERMALLSDPSQQYAASGHIMNDASPVRKGKRHRAEGIGEIDYTKLRPLDVDTTSGLYKQVKENLENYIGQPLTDQHVATMLRLTHAETAAKLKDPREAAAILGSALNRGIYRHGGGAEGFEKAIMARSQFASVTSPKGGSLFRPTPEFKTGPAKSRLDQLMGAIAEHLPYVPHDFQYFTSADPRAYGKKGAGHPFYRKMKGLEGSEKLGGTIFQAPLSSERVTDIPESIRDPLQPRKILRRKPVEDLTSMPPNAGGVETMQDYEARSSAEFLRNQERKNEGQRAKEQSEKIEERKWLPPKEIQQQPMHDSRVERTSSPVAMNEVPERATYHKLSDLFGEVPHLNKQMSVG